MLQLECAFFIQTIEDVVINLPGVTVCAASLFIDFVYDNNFSLDGVDTEEDLPHLLSLAEQFGVKDLVHAVKQYITPTKMDDMPDEVLVEIYRHLTVREILTMKDVSVHHQLVAKQKCLWQDMEIGGLALSQGGQEIFDLVNVSNRDLAWVIPRVKHYR